jgi:hypothetical protein
MALPYQLSSVENPVGKIPEELGYLGTYILLIKHGPKGAADYMK